MEKLNLINLCINKYHVVCYEKKKYIFRLANYFVCRIISIMDLFI